MIKKVKDQTGKELTNADVDIILEIQRELEFTNMKPKVENGKVIEELSVILMTLDIGGINRYEAQKDIVSLISNALNQQRKEIVGEIDNEMIRVSRLGLRKIPTMQKVREFLTKLEK